MAAGALPGEAIGGRYRLIEPLGRGGFGQVWKAYDEKLRVDVAIKQVSLPPGSTTENARHLARALREGPTAARLREHPNIVTVYDVVEENGVPWTVMRLVDGETLEQRLRHGPMPTEQVAGLARALLAALGAAHQAGIVHRDVKPANVLLAHDGGILLADFGIATVEGQTGQTRDGTVIGSLEYIAPERLDGVAAHPASDLYSLGVTLYEATEGTSPFRRPTPTATLKAVVLGQPPPPTNAGPLTGLITALMAKNPAARPTLNAAVGMVTPTLPRPPENSAGKAVGAVAAIGGIILAIATTVAIAIAYSHRDAPNDNLAPAGPPMHYGAIAVADDGSYGRASNYGSASAAAERALNSCPGSGCKILARFVNGCGAIAYNAVTRQYWGGNGGTSAEAEQNAIANAGGGRWIVWVCTAR